MVFIRPSVGLWFGFGGAANKDSNGDRETKGNGGLVLGNLAVQLGLLGGGVVGFGNRWGLYTGLQGALSLLPFLGMGFIGIPLGLHFNKKWGLGIIIPIFLTQWYIGLIAGIGIYLLARWMSRRWG